MRETTRIDNLRRDTPLLLDELTRLSPDELGLLAALLDQDGARVQAEIDRLSAEYQRTKAKVPKAHWAALHTRREIARTNANLIRALLDAEGGAR